MELYKFSTASSQLYPLASTGDIELGQTASRWFNVGRYFPGRGDRLDGARAGGGAGGEEYREIAGERSLDEGAGVGSEGSTVFDIGTEEDDQEELEWDRREGEGEKVRL